MHSRVTTSISSGELGGTREDGVDRYLGIPYAAAPVGEHRFAAPVPAPAWEGVREATELGPTAPQNPYAPQTAALLANVISPGDEYLNVNVWAPAGARDRPVMVWVHGGSFAHGSNTLDGYDGTAFARDGVVFVGVNYRLGAEGFSVLDGVPLNLGLQDVAAALRWVRGEIAAELFDRVILQSGPPDANPPKKAGKITRLTARKLGLPTTREAFAATPSERLLGAEKVITEGSTPLTGGAGYSPAIDGSLVPRPPIAAIVDGAGDGIPVLLGWTEEEYRLFFVPSGMIDRIGRVLFAAARLRFRIGSRILRAYETAYPVAGRGELFGRIATDIILRVPLQRAADARFERGAPTWVYEFAWPSPVADLRATHVMELPFVFDRLRSPDWTPLTGPDAPQSLATEMHAAWVRFASTGDPGWRAWDDRRPVMVFDAPESTVTNARRDAELAAWRRRK